MDDVEFIKSSDQIESKIFMSISEGNSVATYKQLVIWIMKN